MPPAFGGISDLRRNELRACVFFWFPSLRFFMCFQLRRRELRDQLYPLPNTGECGGPVQQQSGSRLVWLCLQSWLRTMWHLVRSGIGNRMWSHVPDVYRTSRRLEPPVRQRGVPGELRGVGGH